MFREFTLNLNSVILYSGQIRPKKGFEDGNG